MPYYLILQLHSIRILQHYLCADNSSKYVPLNMQHALKFVLETLSEMEDKRQDENSYAVKGVIDWNMASWIAALEENHVKSLTFM